MSLYQEGPRLRDRSVGERSQQKRMLDCRSPLINMDIFLSRPNWLESRFESGMSTFCARLTDAGLNPRTLGQSDYPISAPLDEVLAMLTECKGAIILGYPQISIVAGTVKAEPVKAAIELATEWNHIEAALAYARQMPLMIVHHVGIGRGVFERGVMSSFVYTADLANPLWAHASELNGALATWKSRVAKFTPISPVRRSDIQAPRGSQACPNCSTSDRPFFMTRLPAASRGFTHLCNKCKGTFDYS